MEIIGARAAKPKTAVAGPGAALSGKCQDPSLQAANPTGKMRSMQKNPRQATPTKDVLTFDNQPARFRARSDEK